MAEYADYLKTFMVLVEEEPYKGFTWGLRSELVNTLPHGWAFLSCTDDDDHSTVVKFPTFHLRDASRKFYLSELMQDVIDELDSDD